MRRKRYAVLSAVMVLVVVVAYVLGTRLIAPHLFYSADHQSIGANVTVTGAKVPRAMNAIEVALKPPTGSQYQLISKTIDVTPSGALPAPVTLQFRLDRQVQQGQILLVATSESENGPWSMMKPTVSSDGWYATVQTTHLSLFSFTNVFASALVDAMKSFFNVLSDNLFASPPPPHCDQDYFQDQTLAHEGYSISWINRAFAQYRNSSAIYWCFGIENGKPAVKIVNKLRYPLEVSHQGFTFYGGNDVQFSFDQLARLGAGPDTILYPFQEADYYVPAPVGSSLTIKTDASAWAAALGAFQTTIFAALFLETALSSLSAAPKAVDVVLTMGKKTYTLISGLSKENVGKLLTFINAVIADVPACASAISQFVRNQDILGLEGTCLSAILDVVAIVSVGGGVAVVSVGILSAVLGLLSIASGIFSLVTLFHDTSTNVMQYDVTVDHAAPASAPPSPPTPSPPTTPPSPPTQPPSPPTQPPSPPTQPPSQPVDAYNNYGVYNGSYPMCRGNIYYSPSQPGGTVSQTFTVPAGVATLNGAEVQIDPDSRVTAHLSILRNGTVVAATSSTAAGDTYFTYGSVSVNAGDTITLSINFTATYGSIITVYSAGKPGGTFSVSNSCASSSTTVTSASVGLRAVVSGMS